MARRSVGLSMTLDKGTVADPPFMRPRISYQTHGETVAEPQHFFPGATAEQLPGGQGFGAAVVGVADVAAGLARIGHDLRPLDIGYCPMEKLANPRGAAGERFHRLLLSRQGDGRVRRLDARVRHLRGLNGRAGACAGGCRQAQDRVAKPPGL